jgi:hypothetical protein
MKKKCKILIKKEYGDLSIAELEIIYQEYLTYMDIEKHLKNLFFQVRKSMIFFI